MNACLDRRFGHDRVSVMDGGWAKWMAENRDITPDSPCPLKVQTLKLRSLDLSWLAEVCGLDSLRASHFDDAA